MFYGFDFCQFYLFSTVQYLSYLYASMNLEWHGIAFAVAVYSTCTCGAHHIDIRYTITTIATKEETKLVAFGAVGEEDVFRIPLNSS